MSRRELTIHFYAKVILIVIIIPYSLFFMIFLFPNEISGKILGVLLLGLMEYTFFKMTVKEYKKTMGIRPKYKPNKKNSKGKSKDKDSQAYKNYGPKKS